jgi:hypothetical protein
VLTGRVKSEPAPDKLRRAAAALQVAVADSHAGGRRTLPLHRDRIEPGCQVTIILDTVAKQFHAFGINPRQ